MTTGYRRFIGTAGAIGLVLLGVAAQNPAVWAVGLAAAVLLAVIGLIGAGRSRRVPPIPTADERPRGTAIRSTGGGTLDLEDVRFGGWDTDVETTLPTEHREKRVVHSREPRDEP